MREYTVKEDRRGGRVKRDSPRNNRVRVRLRLEKKAARKIRGIGLRHSINYGCICKINHPIERTWRIQEKSCATKYRRAEIYIRSKQIISIFRA